MFRFLYFRNMRIFLKLGGVTPCRARASTPGPRPPFLDAPLGSFPSPRAHHAVSQGPLRPLQLRAQGRQWVRLAALTSRMANWSRSALGVQSRAARRQPAHLHEVRKRVLASPEAGSREGSDPLRAGGTTSSRRESGSKPHNAGGAPHSRSRSELPSDGRHQPSFSHQQGD